MVAVSSDIAIGSGLSGSRRWYVRYAAELGYGIAAAVILLGWLGRELWPISAATGLGYWLGIVGASLMAVVLLYPVRKRFRVLHVIGSTRAWFQLHMVLGVVGPVLILYHCNFQLGSLNAKVALFSTLLVAGSGLIGRYLYSKIHVTLYGSKANLQGLMERAKLTADQEKHTAAFVPDLLSRMEEFDQLVLASSATMGGSMLLPMQLAVRTRWARFQLGRLVHNQLREQALHSPAIARQQNQFEVVLKKFIAEHLRRVRRVAEFGFYERLFSLWHLAHLPVFYILVLTAIIHVVAVHMY